MKRRLALLIACWTVVALIACGLNPQPLPPDERQGNASSTTLGPMHKSSSATPSVSNFATSSGSSGGSLAAPGSSMATGSSTTTGTSSATTASFSSVAAAADAGEAGDGGSDAQGDGERPDDGPTDGASEHD